VQNVSFVYTHVTVYVTGRPPPFSCTYFKWFCIWN